VQWSFSGDKELSTAPILVRDETGNQYVIIGSSNGNLYALNATSGTTEWTQALGNNIVQLSLGDGLLVAVTETGNNNSGTLTAYAIAASP